jgi:hypothetical protein
LKYGIVNQQLKKNKCLKKDKINVYRHLFSSKNDILFSFISVAAKRTKVMGRRPKEIVYPHLNDCKGDVKGKWYVEFTVLNKLTGEKIR